MSTSVGSRLARRETSNWLLGLFYALHIALVSLAMVVYATDLLDPIVFATVGLVNETLLLNLVLLLVIVGGVLLGLGRLAPIDLGLSVQKLPSALAATAAIWLAAQAVLLVAGVAASGVVAIHPLWGQRGVGVVLGLLLAQVLGNALVEEIGYRGFLLPQLRIKLGRVLATRAPKASLLAALALSQVLFALMHVPNRVANGVELWALPLDLVMPLLLGVLFALIYLRTENLFLAVGAHSLLNAPTALFAAPMDPSLVVLGGSLLLLALWRGSDAGARGGLGFGMPRGRLYRSAWR